MLMYVSLKLRTNGYLNYLTDKQEFVIKIRFLCCNENELNQKFINEEVLYVGKSNIFNHWRYGVWKINSC